MRKNKWTKTLVTSALALSLAISALFLGAGKPAFAAETTAAETTAAETTAAAEPQLLKMRQQSLDLQMAAQNTYFYLSAMA